MHNGKIPVPYGSMLHIPLTNYHLRAAMLTAPQWGAADAEIKVPSGENTELRRSPFKAWSRSVYSHTCYAYCQGFLPCLFLSFQPIHLHFFPNLSQFFLCWLWPIHGFCVGPQNRSPCQRQVPVFSACGIERGSKNMTCGMTCEMNNLEIG